MNSTYIFNTKKFCEVFDYMSESDAKMFIGKLLEKQILEKTEKQKKIEVQRIQNSKYGDGELHFLCVQYNKENENKYPPEFYGSFLEYWTAPILKGRQKGKEQWRDQKTFQLSQRLATSYKLTWQNGTSNQKQETGISNQWNANKPKTKFITNSEGDNTSPNDNGIKTIRIG